MGTLQTTPESSIILTWCAAKLHQFTAAVLQYGENKNKEGYLNIC
ncbi:hypothetical protein [Chitinophaga caeni]|nr:hypothetical protein [Chitinophaga caeni]